jgi:hypothetical protein
MDEQRTTIIRLAQGMTETLPGGLRTSVHIRSGRVSIRFPAEWLAASVVAREQVLVEGDRQSLAAVRQVEATALVATEVLLIREAGLAITLCARAAERMRKVVAGIYRCHSIDAMPR